MDTPNLHDACFLRLLLIWGNDDGEAKLVFDTAEGLVVLKASGVTNLNCPHENPWGGSVCVNEVRGPFLVRENVERIELDEVRGPFSVLENVERVEVEMQSGDTLVIEAKAWVWAEAGAEDA